MPDEDDPWRPTTDPRRYPVRTRADRIADWLFWALIILVFGGIETICIIGLVKTWHGGTWNP